MPDLRRRLASLARFGVFLFVCLVFLPIAIHLTRVVRECRVFTSDVPEAAAVAPEALPAEVREAREGLVDYERKEEQGYLTFPEWYIVYSAEEYAAFIKENPPSQFPYFKAMGQYWQGYYDICAVTRDEYPFNSTYHMTLMVIGSSFTVENVLKGVYENTVGRVTEWTSAGEPTQEDLYAQRVAEEYGAFLHTVPWFEFPFREKLAGLWAETDLWGANPIRKWERKLALSVEYGSKAGYGWLIKQGSASVYGPEMLAIQAWAEGVSERLLRQEPQLRLVKQLPAGGSIVALPRYEPFTQLVPELVRQGVRFVEIAGNDEILITVLAPREWEYSLEGSALFEMPILTQPDLKRVALRVPVPALHRVLVELERQSIALEHLYDY